jgi:hypothetical protein
VVGASASSNRGLAGAHDGTGAVVGSPDDVVTASRMSSEICKKSVGTQALVSGFLHGVRLGRSTFAVSRICTRMAMPVIA